MKRSDIEKNEAITPIVSFLAGAYPGSLGGLEITRSERYNMIAFTPEAFETPVVKYTWYFLPDGTFDGTSGELRQTQAVPASGGEAR